MRKKGENSFFEVAMQQIAEIWAFDLKPLQQYALHTYNIETSKILHYVDESELFPCCSINSHVIIKNLL